MTAGTPGQNESASSININTASTAELEKLPGIGKILAERIVAHREQHGSFRRAEHLLMVRGISDRKFREIRSMLTVKAELRSLSPSTVTRSQPLRDFRLVDTQPITSL